MGKDFDSWNDVKKRVDARSPALHYHAREVWWANIGFNVGFEQDGTGELCKRPVLVLRGLSLHVCIVVPLTTSPKRDCFYIDAGMANGRQAAAIISQIRLIDTRRLVEKIGMLDKNHFEVIRKRPEHCPDHVSFLPPDCSEGKAEAICISMIAIDHWKSIAPAVPSAILTVMTITFITGNQKKADYLAKYLGFPVEHVKLDLDELQSLNLLEIVEHKVRQAYEIVKGPVIVEDVSLEFAALGRLPGPFIRFFVDEVPFETMCRMLDGYTRAATARCVFGYYDGTTLKLFEGSMNGTIAEHPAGENGYGWDRLFIPEGYTITRAQMGEEDDQKTYLQIKPFAAVKEFLVRDR